MRIISSGLKWGILAGLMVFVLGIVDALTGYELNFFVFYFLPVSVGAWFLGFAGAASLAILSAGVLYSADVLTGHTYTSSFYAVWDNLVHFVSFLAIGCSVSRIKLLLDHERNVTESLRRTLSQIKVLESFLPICAQCKKIRNQQGVWQQLEAYIGQHSNTIFSHGYCPECARKIKAEIALINTSSKLRL